jgi:hypothetical protein
MDVMELENAGLGSSAARRCAFDSCIIHTKTLQKGFYFKKIAVKVEFKPYSDHKHKASSLLRGSMGAARACSLDKCRFNLFFFAFAKAISSI